MARDEQIPASINESRDRMDTLSSDTHKFLQYRFDCLGQQWIVDRASPLTGDKPLVFIDQFAF
jgi:hypothetical protein